MDTVNWVISICVMKYGITDFFSIPLLAWYGCFKLIIKIQLVFSFGEVTVLQYPAKVKTMEYGSLLICL